MSNTTSSLSFLAMAMLTITPLFSASKFVLSEVRVSTYLGLTQSKFNTKEDMKIYFDPAGKASSLLTPMGGMEGRLRWQNLMISLGGNLERVGQITTSAQVGFQGNPFPHDLETETWIQYFVVPLQVGFGLAGSRHQVFVRGGVYGALVMDKKMQWTVDGSSYETFNSPTVYDAENGSIFALEYALVLGRSKLLLEVLSRRGISDIAWGLSGSAKLATQTVRLGYGFALH